MPRSSFHLTLLLVFAACSPEPADRAVLPESEAAEAAAEERVSHLDEFLAIAAELEAGRAPYLGRARILEMRRALTSETTPLRRAGLTRRLGEHLLRIGQVDQAVALVEEARSILDEAPGDAEPSPRLIAERERVRAARAQAYLRQAELRNCIARHDSDCCIFPLEGGGVHTEVEPARKALDIYLELAREEPRDLSHRWMCNLLAMALGDHPGALPEDVVIPIEAFDSEVDLGRFPDVAPRTGVDLFSLAGGSAIEDYDGDGLLDIVFSNLDPRGPLALLHNGGSGSFVDRAPEARLDEQLGGLNLISADYDSDGDPDLFVLRGGWLSDDGRIRNSLLRNEADGTFTDVTAEAGLDLPAAPTQTAAFADFDADGALDLYVGNESAHGKDGHVIGLPAQLFMNAGDGTFRLSEQAENRRYAKGVAAGDYDGDGDVDLYVSNIGSAKDLGLNRLYRNDGEARFDDVAPDLGVTGPSWSFVTWFFDYDNDGQLDLFVAGCDASMADVAADYLDMPDRATRPGLYRNEGGTFRDVAREVGLDRPFEPMGANFGDFDNDGWLDVYLTTGDPRYDTLMPNVALRNDRGKRFQDVTRSAGLGHLQKGHGVTFADVDDDGDQDVVHELGGFFPGDGYANALFENPGHGNRFLQVELVGTTSNRGGLGTKLVVVVEGPEGRRELHRWPGSVSSFGGGPRRQELGLGKAERIVRLEVRWPASDTHQTFEEVPLDARVRVTEGSDALEVLPMRPFVLGS